MNKVIAKVKEVFIAEKYLNKIIMTIVPVHYIFYLIILSIEYFAPIFLAYIWKNIIDSMTVAQTNAIDISFLLFIVITYSLVMLINVVLGFLSSTILFPYIQDKVTHLLDIKIMNRMSKIDMPFFDNPENRNTLEIVQNSKQRIIGNIDYLCKTLFAIIAFLSAMIMFCSYNLTYAVIFSVTCIPGAFFEYKNQVAMDMFSLDHIPKQRKKNYFRSLLTSDDTAQELRLYNLADYFKSKYNGLWNEIRDEREIVFKRGTYKVFLASILRNASMVMIIILSVFSIKDASISIGTLSLFVELTYTINSHITNLISSIPFHFSRTIPYVSQFIEFMKNTDSTEDGKAKQGIRFPEIEFRNVYFKYPNADSYVINNMSFRIKSREKIALVGVNGAGKSTIIKLILHLYEPNSGEILIAGKNIKEYKQFELYSVFGVCFQNITKYAMTVKENILISSLKDRTNRDKFESSVLLSGLDRIFEAMPNGFETELTRQFSPDGYEPSLGQWQRIAIARTLFRNADITILDEPSSALDPEAEDFVFKSFEKYCKNKGGIVVSHRLSNILMVDRILLIEDGRLLESGSHSELMRLGGRYAELYHMQSDKYMTNSTKGEI